MKRTFLIPKEWNGYYVRVQMELTSTEVKFVVEHHNKLHRADPKPKYSEKFGVDLHQVEILLLYWKHGQYGEMLDLLDTLPTYKQEAKKSWNPRQIARMLRRLLAEGVLPDEASPHFRVPKKRIADVATEVAYPIQHDLPPLLPPEPTEEVTPEEVIASLQTWRW